MTTLRSFGRRSWHADVSGEVYVETGLDNGDSFAHAVAFDARPFNRLIGIEIHPEYARRCRERFAGDSRVEIVCGDSARMLPNVLDPDFKTVFWLDAHWCEAQKGEGGRESPEFGPCVLLEELRIIRAQPWRVRPTVLIDDAAAFCSREGRQRDLKPGAYGYPTFLDVTDALGGVAGPYQFAVVPGDTPGGIIVCF